MPKQPPKRHWDIDGLYFGDQTDVMWWREQGLNFARLWHEWRISGRSFGGRMGGLVSILIWRTQTIRRLSENVPIGKIDCVDLMRDPENSAIGKGAPLQREPKPIQHPVRYYEKGIAPEYLTTRQWFVGLLDKTDQLIDMGIRSMAS
ncbi:MAG: hypothetical protein Ct9H300mP19_09120 [Dehalococcoidia bacterium]|nr:MAG: hypothetical protein Ct9H300mP19_09120 [Dehalococcoidia bacterium]